MYFSDLVFGGGVMGGRGIVEIGEKCLTGSGDAAGGGGSANV